MQRAAMPAGLEGVVRIFGRRARLVSVDLDVGMEFFIVLPDALQIAIDERARTQLAVAQACREFVHRCKRKGVVIAAR